MPMTVVGRDSESSFFCGAPTSIPWFKKIGTPTPALESPQTPTPG